MEITFDDFMKLDLRVGEVEEATPIPGSRNLLKLVVDFGSEKRQAVAGLLQYYKPEELVNKKFVFLLAAGIIVVAALNKDGERGFPDMVHRGKFIGQSAFFG